MRPGERGKGGHTCQLGLRVRTGGKVRMAARSIKGLILNRPWEEDRYCLGCNATTQEILEEADWLKKKERPEVK